MRYTYDNGPTNARFVQQGIVQGGVGRCGSRDFPSIYVRIRDPDVFTFIQFALQGNFKYVLHKPMLLLVAIRKYGFGKPNLFFIILILITDHFQKQ